MNHKELTDIVYEIDREGRFLTDWEIDFIADLIDRPRKYYSEQMVAKILQIYNRCVR